MKKRLLMIAVAMMTAASSLTGCSLISVNPKEVVVKVNDSEITADVANFYARYTQAQYETYFGAYMEGDMWNTKADKGKTYEESVKATIQDELKQMLVLEQHMKDYNVSLSDAEKEVIQKAVKEFDEDNSLENKEKIMSSEEVVERMLTLMAEGEKMREAIQKDADKNVSDKEAAQKKMDYVLFSYQKEDGEDEEEETAEMTDEEKAAVKEKAESFAKSAKEDSKKFLEIAQDQGADVEEATFDAKTEVPDADLIKAADALKKNEVTDVIETDDGCYVARVTSLMDKDATESRKKEIITERENELFTEVTEKWLDEAKVSVNKKAWKKIDFNALGVTMKQAEKEPYADDVKTDDQADVIDE
ncbi:MAG: peptidyl-prolyl cis-trans isomerase [Dorea sp.]|jgi:hypothetical protein|nr:peptidyl-prolyl cis-trans isomerase [Dorea sp.]